MVVQGELSHGLFVGVGPDFKEEGGQEFVLEFGEKRVQALQAEGLHFSKAVEGCQDGLHYSILMPFPDLLLSLPQLFPSTHCHLHAPKYPLLHVNFPLSLHFTLLLPLCLLLPELPPPHTEVPVAHVFLYDRRVPLRLLRHHLAHRLKHLLEPECSHEGLSRTLRLG